MLERQDLRLLLLCRIEYMGDQFVYVSGRKRAAGEMNGKSSNLNNCLSQIYPPGIPIPPNELVCIFDADQVSQSHLPADSVLPVSGEVPV